MFRMLLHEVAVGRMHRQFSWRHGKDQPVVAQIYRPQLQHIAKEGAVGFGVFTVNQKMGTTNHGGLLRLIRQYNRDAQTMAKTSRAVASPRVVNIEDLRPI